MESDNAYVCKRMCDDRVRSALPVARCWRWSRGQAIVALRCKWHVCVWLRWFQSAYSICLLLWRDWISDRSLNALATFWWKSVPRSWSVTYRFASCHLFSHLYFFETFDYLELDSDFEICMRRNSRKILARWHTVKCFGIPLWNHPTNYLETPSRWPESEWSCHFCFRRLRAFVLFRIYLNASSLSRSGFAHWDVRVRCLLIYLVSSVVLRWYQGVCFWK